MKSWIEIDAARLAANLRAVQAAAGAAVEVLCVVKANGYGHDAVRMAPLLVAGGARWLGVSDVAEGAAVRAATGSGTRLLVMCGMEPADAPQLVEHRLTPVVWTATHIRAMEAAAEAAGLPVAVHLEVDTGMARQGATPGEELAQVLEPLAASKWLHCEGVLSHLSEAEVAGSAITAAQSARFAAALEQVAAAGIRPSFVHLGNSSAVDEGSTADWMGRAAAQLGARPMVRTGLALYGNCLQVAGGSAALRPALQPVMTWKTRIAGLRTVRAGATVGYGATFVAAAPMRLALLPVGYADGFRREASSGLGNGWVMVRGRRAAVVGRVSMNLTVVDVTFGDVTFGDATFGDVPDAAGIAVGEEVVLLGEGVSADDHARWCGTIAYEILCGVRAASAPDV